MTDENKDPEGCESCKWHDPTQAQCFAGHIQRIQSCLVNVGEQTEKSK